MGEYSMNIGSQGIEQERTCDNMGFDSVQAHSAGVNEAQTSYHSIGTGRGDIPGEMASPLHNATVETNDSQKMSIGPSAGDIVARTRNG